MSFSISRPCLADSGLEEVEVEPGREISVSLIAAAPRERWSSQVEGEYTLGLGLIVPSWDRSQIVWSEPFRIDLAPEANVVSH
jgi:hypothetical protein